MKRKLPAVALFFVLAGTCEAGSWLEDALMNTGKRLGERAIHESGDSAYEGAKGTVKGDGRKEEKDSRNRQAADREEESESRKAAKRASGGSSGSSGEAPGSAGASAGEASIE